MKAGGLGLRPGKEKNLPPEREVLAGGTKAVAVETTQRPRGVGSGDVLSKWPVQHSALRRAKQQSLPLDLTACEGELCAAAKTLGLEAYFCFLGWSDPGFLVTYRKHHVIVVFHIPVAFFLKLSHLCPFFLGEVSGNVFENILDLQKRDSM